jgi:oligopeptide transport system ATP-binding protein
MKIDFEEEPPFFQVSETHYAATWLLHPDAPKVESPIKGRYFLSKGAKSND